MLGINLLFAGFALTLNGLSYLTPVDNKVKAFANILVGIVIAINAIFQVAFATTFVEFGFSAAMWMFALNYILIAAHIFFKSDNWKVFGIYSLFAMIVSFTFAGEAIYAVAAPPMYQGASGVVVLGAPWEMVYLWTMWAILWAQSFVSIMFAKTENLTPYVLILNGVASTFIPGLLILLGIIL
ncbi:MAG: AmiS/UreI family transporter [Defluviitaleaceae bacterium]|nr:AmiS/UreI family transporter [Defluviitaleaceae bacterium]